MEQSSVISSEALDTGESQGEIKGVDLAAAELNSPGHRKTAQLSSAPPDNHRTVT